MRLIYITPETPEALAEYMPILAFLSQWLPSSYQNGQLMEMYQALLGDLTLVYAQDEAMCIPIGAFAAEMSRRSAEIHGVARGDLRQLVGRHAGLLVHEAGKNLLETLFLAHGKDMVIAKVPTDSQGGLGFLRRWGFSAMRGRDGIKIDQGRYVWILKREAFNRQYLRGTNGR